MKIDKEQSTQNRTKEEAIKVLQKDKDKIKKEAEALSLKYQHQKTKP